LIIYVYQLLKPCGKHLEKPFFKVLANFPRYIVSSIAKHSGQKWPFFQVNAPDYVGNPGNPPDRGGIYERRTREKPHQFP
jgi:hypothetical protein